MRSVKRMASRTIFDKARMPSIRDVEVVLVVGLIELTVAVETGGQADISERLVQRERNLDTTTRRECRFRRR